MSSIKTKHIVYQIIFVRYYTLTDRSYTFCLNNIYSFILVYYPFEIRLNLSTYHWSIFSITMVMHIYSDVLKAVASKDATGKLFKYDPSKKKVTVLLEGLSGSAGCAVSSDGSFVLVGQFTKSNIKRYWIKGPKAGSSEDFTNAVSNPDNIKRIGSTGNFWVASVVNTATGITNPSAVKVNSDGKVLQTISLKDKFGDTLVSEVNESQGKLYIGTLFGPFAGILKL